MFEIEREKVKHRSSLCLCLCVALPKLGLNINAERFLSPFVSLAFLLFVCVAVRAK